MTGWEVSGHEMGPGSTLCLASENNLHSVAVQNPSACSSSWQSVPDRRCNLQNAHWLPQQMLSVLLPNGIDSVPSWPSSWIPLSVWWAGFQLLIPLPVTFIKLCWIIQGHACCLGHTVIWIPLSAEATHCSTVSSVDNFRRWEELNPLSSLLTTERLVFTVSGINSVSCHITSPSTTWQEKNQIVFMI